jgi:hypothetical protein
MTAFKVTNREVFGGSNIVYTIFDADTNTLAAKVKISYNKSQSFWRCVGPDGLLVRDEGVRKAMYRAIRKHNGEG